MNIDKSKLRIGIWYEDDDGNMYKTNEYFEVPNDKCETYHTCFPLQVNENIREDSENTDRRSERCRQSCDGFCRRA